MQTIVPLSQYYKLDCKLVQMESISFAGLHAACGGYPCKGCPHQPACPHYSFLAAPPINIRKQNIDPLGPTNAELAKKHGVTKRQISKMRKQGLFDV